MYLDSHIKTECSGCTACSSSCPLSAINMQEDEEGFLFPVINYDLCVNCGLCRRVCPWESPQYDNDSYPITLASILKDRTERQLSTSGGGFYAVSKWILENNGIVYGAAFDDHLQVHHFPAESFDELQRLRGSKYVQSNLGKVFLNVKMQLEAGRWCYFTGTGCQIAGLKAFLHKDYPTLLTSDLVCHGVPSQKLFDEHISYMEHKYHDIVVDYKFRDYQSGEGCETCSFVNHRKVVNPSYELSPYLFSFMYGYTFRQSCYECKFAKIPRQGDITLADFWGVQHFYSEFDKRNGVSLLLLNTKKGRWIWEQVREQCIYEVSCLSDAAEYNGNLVRHSEKAPVRDTIYNEIKKRGYKDVARKEFRSNQFFKLKVFYYLRRFKAVKMIYSLLHP